MFFTWVELQSLRAVLSWALLSTQILCLSGRLKDQSVSAQTLFIEHFSVHDRGGGRHVPGVQTDSYHLVSRSHCIANNDTQRTSLSSVKKAAWIMRGTSWFYSQQPSTWSIIGSDYRVVIPLLMGAVIDKNWQSSGIGQPGVVLDWTYRTTELKISLNERWCAHLLMYIFKCIWNLMPLSWRIKQESFTESVNISLNNLWFACTYLDAKHVEIIFFLHFSTRVLNIKLLHFIIHKSYNSLLETPFSCNMALTGEVYP